MNQSKELYHTSAPMRDRSPKREVLPSASKGALYQQLRTPHHRRLRDLPRYTTFRFQPTTRPALHSLSLYTRSRDPLKKSPSERRALRGCFYGCNGDL